jgi:hypothetical protein
MAIFTTALSQTYGPVIGQGVARNTVTQICSVALTTAMIDNANDEVELCWVPKGAVITACELRCTDVDTNGSPTILFDVGDDSSEARLISASTVGQASGTTTTLAVTGFGYKYTAATKIKCYINTAAATAAAGTLYFRINYFVDENFTLANAVVS